MQFSPPASMAHAVEQGLARRIVKLLPPRTALERDQEGSVALGAGELGYKVAYDAESHSSSVDLFHQTSDGKMELRVLVALDSGHVQPLHVKHWQDPAPMAIDAISLAEVAAVISVLRAVRHGEDLASSSI